MSQCSSRNPDGGGRCQRQALPDVDVCVIHARPIYHDVFSYVGHGGVYTCSCGQEYYIDHGSPTSEADQVRELRGRWQAHRLMMAAARAEAFVS